MSVVETDRQQFTTDVIILGAGFSGLAVAAKISRRSRHSYLILEQGDEVGGTWRENTYPGCACDIPSPLYSFSFEQKPGWRQLFATQPEILDYLRAVSRHLEIATNIRFHTRAVSANWDCRAKRWLVATEDGAQYRARYLISAIGVLHRPLVPDLTGIEEFEGPVFHSAAWDHDVDLRDKKVAVIGTGASAIQFIPAIVESVAELRVFQRTPPWIVPKANKQFSSPERAKMRRNPFARWKRRADLFWVHEQRAKGFLGDESAMRRTRQLALDHLRKQVPDPTLRAKLTPHYAIGCKRILISSDYYPALARSHVNLVTVPIDRVRKHSILTNAGEEFSADMVIFGTGFDAQNGLTRVDIRGLQGVSLAQAWPSGPQAYLGTVVSGFPNLFLMCGPNTGLGHNSQIFMIEAQADYVMRCLAFGRRSGIVEVRQVAQNRYNKKLQEALADTVWQAGGCRSWYQDPDTGRNTVLWPKSAVEFWLHTRRLRRTHYHSSLPPFLEIARVVGRRVNR